MRKVKQGGFSIYVWQNSYLQKYVKTGGNAGYIGDFNRTDQRDKILEKYCFEAKLLPYEIGLWLTSTSGRYFMDDVDKDCLKNEFEMKCQGLPNMIRADLKRWNSYTDVIDNPKENTVNDVMDKQIYKKLQEDGKTPED